MDMEDRQAYSEAFQQKGLWSDMCQATWEKGWQWGGHKCSPLTQPTR